MKNETYKIIDESKEYYKEQEDKLKKEIDAYEQQAMDRIKQAYYELEEYQKTMGLAQGKSSDLSGVGSGNVN
jgi:prefoldin subunit 5